MIAIPQRLPFKPTLLFSRLAIGGAFSVCAIAFLCNVRPYTEFWRDALVKVTPLAGAGLMAGAVVFAIGSYFAVQSMEIMPRVVGHSDLRLRAELESAAKVFYLIDLAAACSFFPPINVPLSRFLVAGSPANIDLINVCIILITLFSWEFMAWIWGLMTRVNRQPSPSPAQTSTPKPTPKPIPKPTKPENKDDAQP